MTIHAPISRLADPDLMRQQSLIGGRWVDADDGATVAINGALQRIAKVAQQMPPIRDLHRSRCTLARSLGVGATAVTGDNLDPWMPA